ncbi:MAG: RNA repair domain-containing protein [Candidatus Methanomethylicia archaeon]|nr:RNA repair domain-containing protein [Candidatus Methanomethylicia archaeon]MCX8169336.1 RNA repair domain-containing protein [Candidatus Methanomethylicia archaeon]MDW7988881.1 RNA repair domain-containing protein [Nitrososphaerota archaeon]
MRIRSILNKLFWHQNYVRENYEVIFVHRGALNNIKSIPVSLITKIGKESFEYQDYYGKIHIPFHRIILIRNIKTGEILWRRKPNENKNISY